jgi:RNA polymerase sigma-70 factor (ECF subfamily)
MLNINDEDDFEGIFRAHYEILIRSIYPLILRKDIAEDIVQDLFVQLWDQRNEINIKSNLTSYLRKSAIQRTLNWIKRENRIDLQGDIDDSMIFMEPDRSLHNEVDRISAVRRAIEQLPGKCRLVFILNRYEGLTINEIAEYLQISKNTVENHLGKALRLLRDHFRR